MFYLVIVFALGEIIMLPKPYTSLSDCQTAGHDNVVLAGTIAQAQEPGKGGMDIKAWTCVRQ
jgi:hypothetical protein